MAAGEKEGKERRNGYFLVNTLKGQEIHIHFLASRLDSILQAGGTKIFKYHADPGNTWQYLKSSVRLPRATLVLRRQVPLSPGAQSQAGPT